ncbi:MAG: PocR ligand-binding domain-containing protein [Oscillospiraceae bacterium]|nr:PocR ligand-binding domain-containing protein [Oscillospiraceae bacterium]
MSELDLNSLKLTDVIDVRSLQRIQDAFSKATGMAGLSTDKDGAVTKGSGFTRFCMDLTRGSKVGAERCNKCDLMGGDEAARTGHPSVYTCHGGLCDFAVPIIVNGQHIGSMIGGQVLPEPPDEEKFRKIAREINVDEEEYINAVRQVKVVPRSKIEAAAELLYVVANSLSEAGYQKLLMAKHEEDIEKVTDALSQETGRIEIVSKEVMKTMETLKRKFEVFNEESSESISAVQQSDDIIKYIQDISLQIKLLGFNASIEAKRMGAQGAGFNAIAQEMRRLSDESSIQAENIEEKIKVIRDTTISTSNKFSDTNQIMHQSVNSVKELDKVISDIDSLLMSMKSMR